MLPDSNPDRHLAFPRASGHRRPPSLDIDVDSHRGDYRRLHKYFEATCDAHPDRTAVWTEHGERSYADLDQLANQLAGHLHDFMSPGERVALHLPRSLDTYVALLAVLKAGLTYVPMDPSSPPARLAHIVEDAGLRLIIGTEEGEKQAAQCGVQFLVLDREQEAISARDRRRIELPETSDDPLCYIAYTSGSSGRPKGVGIAQSSICNFVSVATDVYEIRSHDRIYQGMSIAFDFSIEEIWPAWASGATVIAGPNDGRRIGHGLADILNEQGVTVLCIVPTLLATIDDELPSVRTLIVGGEACPRSLVQRWSRPGRRMLNTYGPTEATVTATWAELSPTRPVTIGRAMPTYRVHLCDGSMEAVPPGEMGEICIGGPGVAVGYLNRPELTADRFVPDPWSPSTTGRLYRTGDLGRLTPANEIEYLGRLDDQVKIRGHRIELSEIESLLSESPSIESAVVTTHTAHEGIQELVAYVTVRSTGDHEAVRRELHELLRQRLPAYMVPQYIEILDRLPRLAAGKALRSQLPPPSSARLGSVSGGGEPPATELEAELAALWQSVLRLDRVPVDANFFLDLGGHSLFAARLVSELRTRPAFAGVSIADLYAHPTIRSLAETLASASQDHAAAPTTARVPDDRPPPRLHRSGRVAACGAAQVATGYLLSIIFALPVVSLLRTEGSWRTVDMLTRVTAVVIGLTVVLGAVGPYVASRVLVRSIPPGRYPLWGLTYLRFWLYEAMTRMSFTTLLSGSPLANVHLRLLGADIGAGAHVATAQVNLPHLVTIGEGAHIGYRVGLQPAVVEDGWLTLRPIVVGAGAYIGTNAQVLGGAVIEEQARLGEQSLLPAGGRVPAGETWCGSPARRSPSDDPVLQAIAEQGVTPGRWPRRLLAGYAAGALVLLLIPLLTVLPGLVMLLWSIGSGPDLRRLVPIVAASGPLYVLTTCAVLAGAKSIVSPRVEPGYYPIRSVFALRKWVTDHLIAMSVAFTNSLYATLYVTPWLRLLGADIGPRTEVSTVSNIDPDLLTIGTESFVADIASVGAATFDRGVVAVGPTNLGRRTFVGNAAVVPSYTTLGNETLLGVQSVPAARTVNDGTDWLGSPAMFLPRRQRAAGFDEHVTYQPPAHKIAARLAIEALRVTLPATLLTAEGAAVLLAALWLARTVPLLGAAALLPALVAAAGIAGTVTVAALKWLIVGRYRPRIEPMWCPFVWRTELITALYENVAVPTMIGWLTGTPFMRPALRLFGARIGRRVWMGTTYLTEFDLVEVGDDAAIGIGCSLQTHLFEDRVMKMSTVTVRERASVGDRAVVLYDAEVGAGARVDALSLVMKAERLPPGTHWRGIPASRVAHDRRARAGETIDLHEAVSPPVGAVRRSPGPPAPASTPMAAVITLPRTRQQLHELRSPVPAAREPGSPAGSNPGAPAPVERSSPPDHP